LSYSGELILSLWFCVWHVEEICKTSSSALGQLQPLKQLEY
jgi:hypothetical protein